MCGVATPPSPGRAAQRRFRKGSSSEFSSPRSIAQRNESKGPPSTLTDRTVSRAHLRQGRSLYMDTRPSTRTTVVGEPRVVACCSSSSSAFTRAGFSVIAAFF